MLSFRVLGIMGVLLIGVISGHPANGQQNAPPQNQVDNGPSNKVIAEYLGSYVCVQGETALSLKVVETANDGLYITIFSFGPTASNPTVPMGAFVVRGTIPLQGGDLTLDPVSWLSQPMGYNMVGLSGISNDGGNTFDGYVRYGARCTTFSIHRIFTRPPTNPPTLSAATSNPSPPLSLARPPTESSTKRPQVNATSKAGASEVQLRKQEGTFVVPVLINNALTLNFVLDSGAADVSIPADVVLTLIRTGTLQTSDFLGQQTYRLADGSTVPSETFRIRVLRVGDKEIKNVTGSIAPVQGSLLLGQSFLTRFKSWSIDNNRQVLLLD